MLADIAVSGDKDLTRSSKVKKLYSYAKKGKISKLEQEVQKEFNAGDNFNYNQIQIITHFLQYMLNTHGDAKRKTGRLYSGHPYDVARLLASTLGDSVDCIDIVSAFVHDIPEETYKQGKLVVSSHLKDELETFAQSLNLSEKREEIVLDKIPVLINKAVEEIHKQSIYVKPSDIRQEFEDVVRNLDIDKDEKRIFLEKAERLEFINDKLTKYDLTTGEAINYYDFTEYIISLEKVKEHLKDDVEKALLIKGVDIITNVKELDDIYKDPLSILLSSFGPPVKWIMGKNRPITNKISQKIHDFREDTYAKWIKPISHWANRSRSIPNEQKLFTIYKSFRIVDTINKYFNREGYDKALSKIKQNIISETLMRINTQEEHLLKYHCEGFNRMFLDKSDSKIYDSKGKAKNPINQSENNWLEEKASELNKSVEKIKHVMFSEDFYVSRVPSGSFDALDKIYLDNSIKKYDKAGWIMKRTKDTHDKSKHPFNILEPIYDKIILGQKEVLKEIKADHKEQYVHLQIFKRLLIHYQNDMFTDKKIIKKLNKEDIDTHNKDKRYLTFRWGRLG